MIKELIAGSIVTISVSGVIAVTGFGYINDIVEKNLTNVIEMQSNRFENLSTIWEIVNNEYATPEQLMSNFKLSSSYTYTITDNLLNVKYNKVEITGCEFTYDSNTGIVTYEECKLTDEVKNSVNDSGNIESEIVE